MGIRFTELVTGMISWVVGYREYPEGPEKWYCLYAESAQEAADIVRSDINPYEVLEVFKKVKNWK